MAMADKVFIPNLLRKEQMREPLDYIRYRNKGTALAEIPYLIEYEKEAAEARTTREEASSVEY